MEIMKGEEERDSHMLTPDEDKLLVCYKEQIQFVSCSGLFSASALSSIA